MTSQNDWPQWAQDHFPTTREQAGKWHPITFHRPLHICVLCVAQTRIEGAWSAYCAPVPGVRHDLEVEGVLRHGDKLSEDVARAIFPVLAPIPYAH